MALIVSGALLLQSYCYDGFVTGYSRYDHSPRTYDGTPITSPEPIAGAGWSIPLNAVIEVEGLGQFRVADRGSGLGPSQIDIATWDRASAYALTGWRRVCVTPP
jgi:3D (Asp-Asp-Asp) domain-containing protein